MKRLLFTMFFLAVPALLLAQAEPPPDDGGLNLMTIIGVLIVGAAIPLAVEILKVVWPKAPSWVKGLAGPIIIPAVTFAAGYLSDWLGQPVDVSQIVAVLSGMGISASLAYNIKSRKAA